MKFTLQLIKCGLFQTKRRRKKKKKNCLSVMCLSGCVSCDGGWDGDSCEDCGQNQTGGEVGQGRAVERGLLHHHLRPQVASHPHQEHEDSGQRLLPA